MSEKGIVNIFHPFFSRGTSFNSFNAEAGMLIERDNQPLMNTYEVNAAEFRLENGSFDVVK